MFKLFKKNNSSNAVDFLKEKDLDIANAYRIASAQNLTDGFSREAVRTIMSDINSRRFVDSISSKYVTDKYTNEKFVERNYEVVSESENSVVIKRDVNFKKAQDCRISFSLGDSFSELITIAKTNNGFMVAGIAAA